MAPRRRAVIRYGVVGKGTGGGTLYDIGVYCIGRDQFAPEQLYLSDGILKDRGLNRQAPRDFRTADRPITSKGGTGWRERERPQVNRLNLSSLQSTHGLTSAPAAAASTAHRGSTRDETAPSAEEIAERAYARFQLRGAEHGHDREDWFEAERELKASGRE